MNIGLIGSGGREHALCQKIYESKLSGNIYCFPGNAGTLKIANNIEIDILNFKKLLKLIKFYKINSIMILTEVKLGKQQSHYLVQFNLQLMAIR